MTGDDLAEKVAAPSAPTSPYLLGCGHAVEVPHGGAAECPSCGPLTRYADQQIARSVEAERRGTARLTPPASTEDAR